MRQQATRNADLIRAQRQRQARREMLVAILAGVPIITIFAFVFGYAVAGLLTP